MKLPRWMVIGMLASSVLALLYAAGWWWVTWPERTAQEFVVLLIEQRFQEASKLMRIDSESLAVVDTIANRPLNAFGPELRPRSWTELFWGRQRFRMTGEPMNAGDYGGPRWSLIAERGKVRVTD